MLRNMDDRGCASAAGDYYEENHADFTPRSRINGGATPSSSHKDSVDGAYYRKRPRVLHASVDDVGNVGNLLSIKPSTTLIFPASGPTTEPFNAVVRITNIVDQPVAFKIKTNNLESYRVRPHAGVLEVGKSTDIIVQLVVGFQTRPSDKFLILAMGVDRSDIPLPELVEVWKCNPDSIKEYRLKCAVDCATPVISEMHMEPMNSQHSLPYQTAVPPDVRILRNKVDHLIALCEAVHGRQNRIVHLLALVLSLIVVVLGIIVSVELKVYTGRQDSNGSYPNGLFF